MACAIPPLQVLTTVLEQGGEGLQLRAIDILLSAVQHDARPLRDFLLEQEHHTLFSLLIRCGVFGGVLHLAGQLQGSAVTVIASAGPDSEQA